MDWKNFARKLLLPPFWLMAVLTVASAAALIMVFVKGWETQPAAYIVYVAALYTLCAVTAFCILRLPQRYRQIKQKLYDSPMGSRYMTDRAFRAKISLYMSLGINLVYVGIQVLQWYLQRSWWFVVLACYYVILSFMRFLLVGYVRAHEPGVHVLREWKRSRVCAYILLTVNLFLSGAVLMILYQNRGFEYRGILIYVMALYTFYSTIHAAVDIFRYRKLGSPVMSTAKIVSLSAALVAMLSLESAMFSQFGADMAPGDQRLMIILTGAGVSIAVVTLSVALIARATKEIRSIQYGK